MKDPVERGQFKTILNQCSQRLEELEFLDVIDPAAVKLLCTNKTQLASIQYFRGIHNMKDVMILNFRFRYTITHLDFVNMGTYNNLLEQFGGGLIEFTAQFPQLKILNASWHHRPKETIDLAKLLQSNPNLVELVLDNTRIVKKYSLMDIKRKKWSSQLSELVITAKEVDVTVFHHIIPQLNELDRLVLDVRKINPDKSLPDMIAEHVIQSVCKLPVRYKRINCRFKKKLYTDYICYE